MQDPAFMRVLRDLDAMIELDRKKVDMGILLYPYKTGSRGANAVKTALRILGDTSFVMQKEPKFSKSLIVNWGCSEFGWRYSSLPFIVNHPLIVRRMTNKRRFFEHVGKDPLLPNWTFDGQEALEWKKRVFARYKLESSGGEGIVEFDPKKHTDFPINAPLYTEYVNKSHEYRVHMGRGFYKNEEHEPLLVQRKIFKKGHNGLEMPKDWAVRNHDNGFIYITNDTQPTPTAVLEACKVLMEKHFKSLHFAALDVIYSAKQDRAWILEGNTAPGLEGKTIQVYADYFHKLHGEVA